MLSPFVKRATLNVFLFLPTAVHADLSYLCPVQVSLIFSTATDVTALVYF